ncbi:MAG: OmpA family protein [Gallionellaceae bacterium]
MNILKASSTLGLAVLAAFISPLAASTELGWMMGANIGESRANIDDVSIKQQLQADGLAWKRLTEDYSQLAFKLYGGYKFNENFAVEGGYFDLGRFGYTATTTPTGSLSGHIKLKGINIDAVGFLPVTEKLSAFARAGVSYAEAKDTFTSSGAVATPTIPNPSETAMNYKFGFGAQYEVLEHVAVRGEWERYRINDAVGNQGDIDMVSLGLIYMFGKEKPLPPKEVVAAAPVMVVVAPPPPPKKIIVIVPVLVKTQQYCSILDIQFSIKNDEMQREDKEKLAVLGRYMAKYPETTAVIEGHSDDVGTPEFNMGLSQRRAESVVAYLKDSFKISGDRLSAVGYGETRPIADNSTLEGKQANRRIDAVIACATDVAGLKVVAERITMAMFIEFDPLKSNVDPKYDEDLAKVATFMKDNPSITATIEGHAGRFVGTGDDKYKVSDEKAMEVSQARAQNTVNYLVDKFGVPRSRLSTAQFGNTRRVAYGTTLEGQQENRRVNIIFNYSK